MFSKNTQRIFTLGLLALALFASSCQNFKKDDATAEYLKQYSDQKKPLEIDYFAPTGTVMPSQNKIVVHFSQPMVPLAALGDKTKTDLVKIEPLPEGYFKWVNTKTLVYQVKGNFSFATDYKVTVVAGKQSLLGFALLKDQEFHFTTPEPRITGSAPVDLSSSLRLETEFKLYYNQKLESATLAKFIQLTSNNVNLPVTVSCPEVVEYAKDNETVVKTTTPKECESFIIKPSAPLTKDTAYQLNIKKGVTGVEGPNASLKEEMRNYRTYGMFSIQNLRCGQNISCRSTSGINITSTNEIPAKDLEKFLTFDPPLRDFDAGDIYWSSYDHMMHIYTRLQPFTDYTVTVSPELVDVYGQKLGAPAVFHFKTEHEPARLNTPYLTDQIINQHEGLDFGIYATNILSATANFKTHMSDQDVIALFTDSKMMLDDLNAQNKWDVVKEVTGNISDKQEYHKIPAAEVLSGSDYDIFLVNYTSPQVMSMDYQTKLYSPTNHWFVKQVTDLAIDAKLSEKDGLVWVTSLNTGENVAQAHVKIYANDGTALFQGVTDAQGIIKLPGKFQLNKSLKTLTQNQENATLEPLYIFAQKGSDRSYIGSDWMEGVDNGWYEGDYYDEGEGEGEEEGVSTSMATPVKLRAHMLTDRGLYKPGEEVHIKGYVREVTDKGFGVFNKPLKLQITEPENDKPYEVVVTPNERGNFTFTYKVADETPLGSFSVDLVSDDKAVTFDSQGISFDVLQFRTPDFKVEVGFDKKQYAKGDVVHALMNAQYLFGAPIKAGKLDYYIRKDTTSFVPPNDRDWQFGSLMEHEEDLQNLIDGEMDEGHVKLDDQGHFDTPIETKSDSLSPINLTVEAEVSDLSNQVQAGSSQILLHPASFYVGAKVGNLFFDVNSPINVSFAALGLDGSYLFDKEINVDLMQVKWVSVKRQTLNGEYESEQKREETRLDGCTKLSAEKENTCEFKVSGSGYFFMKLTAKDEKGRVAQTEVPFYVSGSTYSYWPSEDGNSLELVKDKLKYSAGDVARVMVKSPYQSAYAMIAVERDHILSYEVKKLEGSSPVIEIPVKPEYAPNVFVKVVLIKGATDIDPTQNDIKKAMAQALVKAGAIEIPVDPLGKNLNVKVSSKEKIYRPGDVVDLDFSVDNLAPNQESEITVMVVDEGVLLAGGYNFKNPLETLYAPFSHDVSQMDARTHFWGQQGSSEKLEESSSGGGRDSGFRKKFIPLAYFNGELITSGGKAHVTFTVPEQLTTFKVMVIANSSIDQFGLAQTDFQTQKPLMVRPSLPRFLRVGDTVKSKVVLNNQSDQDLKVSLHVEAENLTIESGADGSVTIPKKGSGVYEVEFATSVKELTELINQQLQKPDGKNAVMAKVNFTADAGAGFNDQVQISLPITLERQEETVATSGVSAGEVSEFVDKSGDIANDFGGLDIHLSGNLLSKLVGKIKVLREYPYDCTEQRMSKVYPMVLFPHNDDYFTGDEKKESVRFDRVEEFLKYLKANQNYYGEFSLWPNGDPYSSLTIQVGEFLLAARDAGHNVDTLLAKIQDRVPAYLRGDNYAIRNLSPEYVKLLKINSLYFLYQVGAPVPSYYGMFRDGFEGYDMVTQSRIIEMLHASSADDPIVKSWFDSLKNKLRIKGQGAYVESGAMGSSYYFGQSVRSNTAIVLSTLIKLDPGHPFLFQLLTAVLDDKGKGTYRSSYETLEVLKMLSLYQRIYPNATQPVLARLLMNDKEVLQSSLNEKKPEDAISIPIGKLPEKMTLKIKNETKNILFYDIHYKYALNHYRSYGLEEGITLSRTYFDLDGNEVSAQELKQGQTYRVELNFFFADNTDYVVIDEPLAAGTEPVNFALKNVRQSLQDTPGAQSANMDLSWRLNHKEFRDQKILLFADFVSRGFYEFSYYINVTNAGEYQVPPANAMEMYHPEIFGTTAGTSVEIQ